MNGHITILASDHLGASLAWYELALRLGVAALLGAVLGIEREARGRDAGIRTHMLLALGSALFAAASVGGFDDFIANRASTNVAVDVTRIAAYVAPGVGFIGAGVIVKQLRDDGQPWIRGLTTATSLWCAAAVGVASGIGFWAGAALATGMALLALAAVRPISNWIDRRFAARDEEGSGRPRLADGGSDGVSGPA